MKRLVSTVSKLISPPTSPDIEKDRLVHSLYFILLVLFLASFSLAVLGIIRTHQLSGSIAASVFLSIPLGFMLFALRRGFLRPIRLLLPILIWVTITFSVTVESGIRSVDVAGFTLVIATAGLLIDSWAALAFGTLCLVTVGSIFAAGQYGLLALDPAQNLALDEIGVLATILGLTTFMIYYAVRHLERSTERIKADAHLLIQRNEALQAIQASLQAQTQALSQVNAELRYEMQERQQVEVALKQSEATNRAILDYLPDMILRLNVAGRFLGYSPSKSVQPIMLPPGFVGQHLWDVFPRDVATVMMKAIALTHTTQVVQVLEYVQAANGRWQTFEARHVPVGDSEVIIIIRDVTDERQAEQATLQTQKLESIGLLAGGVAHDFNNLLTGMLGQNALALAKLPPEAPARRHVEKAVTSARRAADLTRQLLAYAGKGQFQIMPIDLNQLVSEGAGLLETVLPKKARLLLELWPDLPPIEADRGQIQQVLMNLVINAAEAIHNPEGQVAIRTSLVSLTAVGSTASAGPIPTDFVMPTAIKPGVYVCLEIEDTGQGMAEEVQKQIFDPYYSTKGQGRGLGLSATLGIIRSYEGALRLHSVENVGTRFQIYLPAGQNLPVDEESRAMGSGSQRGHVLVVDDEEAVRQAATEILEAAGFQVLTATDGRHGKDLFEEHHLDIELVLLDIHMPVMSGLEAFRAIRQIDASVPVLFSSGYTEILTAELLRQPETDFLPKPYDIDLLLTKVQQLMGGRVVRKTVNASSV